MRIVVVLCMLFVCGGLVAQNQSPQCGTPEVAGFGNDGWMSRVFNPLQSRNNGWMMTSHRYVKAVVVFTEFPDDEYFPDTVGPNVHPEWKKGHPPIWVQQPRTLFEPVSRYSETVFEPAPFSASDYFWKMSRQRFDTGLRVYADCFYVPYNRTREEVLDKGIRQDVAIAEVIKLLDEQYGGQGIDFAQYDRWTTLGPHSSTYGPDGVVDLIIVVWRNGLRDLIADEPPWNQGDNFSILKDTLRWSTVSRMGFALGTRYAHEVDPLPILLPLDGGLRFAQTRSSHNIVSVGPSQQYTPTGASVVMMNFLRDVPMSKRFNGVVEDQFRVLIHEIGHVLNIDHRESGSWSVLSVTDSRGYGMSSRDLIELGWAQPTVVQRGDSARRVTIGDLYTTGECLAVEIDRDPDTNYAIDGPKWYVFENHQHISPYDFTSSFDSVRTRTSGLYAHFFESVRGTSNGVGQHIQSADGAFAWNSEYEFVPPWGGKIPAFKRLGQVRRGGATRSESIPLTKPWVAPGRRDTLKEYPIYSEVIDETPRLRQHWLGEFPGDHHSATQKPIWSPWSSPGSTYTDHGRRTATTAFKPIVTNASVHIVSENNGIFTIDVCADGTPIGPPDEIINLTCPESVGIAPDDPEPILYAATISWSPNLEPDLSAYRIWRKPGITTNAWEVIAEVDNGDTVYHDSVSNNPFGAMPEHTILRSVRYAVDAVDDDGNVSIRCRDKSVTIDWMSGEPPWPEYLDTAGVNSVELRLSQSAAIVSPNPARQYIRVTPLTISGYVGDAALRVFTVDGTLLDAYTFRWDSNRESVTTNIAVYPPGSYVVVLQRGRELSTARFVKGE